MTINTLRSLQKRIREATGPDRELDCEIDRVLRGRQVQPDLAATFSVDGKVWVSTDYYTTDPDGLGACVALQRAVLPGWRRRVREGEQFLVELREPRAGWEQAQYDTHAFETHAHLLAIIAARIAVIEEMEKADATQHV